MQPLHTFRLTLRPFQEADLAAFAAYRSDPEVARYQSWETPYSLEQAREFLAEMQSARPGEPGTWYQLAVERRAVPGLIGDCAFQVLPEDPKQAQIGFTFAREFQGKGFASEAVQRLLDFLFNDLHLHRVQATCDALNTDSFRLLERVGMRCEAHHLENIWFKGSWGSEYGYAILAREWQELSQGRQN